MANGASSRMDIRKKKRTSSKFDVRPDPTANTGHYSRMNMPEGVTNQKQPAIDLPPITPQIKLKNAQKRLESANNRLLQTRQRMEKTKEFLNEQWRQLEQREKELHEHFQVFNKFVESNKKKRDRALRKIERDNGVRIDWTNQLDSLKEKFAEQEKMYLNVQEQLVDLIKYESFIDRVIEVSGGEFKDRKEVTDRINALICVKGMLHNRQYSGIRRLSQAKGVTNSHFDLRFTEVVKYYNILADANARYAEARRRSSLWENTLRDLQHTIIRNLSELITNKSTIYLIYDHISKRERISKKKRRRNTLDKLGNIDMSMNRLQHTREAMEKLAEKVKKNRDRSVKIKIPQSTFFRK